MDWFTFRAAVAGLARHFFRALPASPTVLLIAGNRIEFITAFHAGLLADATVFPLSPQLSPVEWREAARRSGAMACIGEPEALDALADVVPVRMGIDNVPLERGPATDAAALAAAHRGTGSILLQSSGTTGLPKIVRRPLAALEAVGDNCRIAVGLTPADHLLAVIPVCHSYGIDHAVMAAALSGCAVELHARFDIAAARDALTSGRITVFPAVPFIFEALAKSNDARARSPSVRHAFSAGSPLPQSVFDLYSEAFGAPLGQLYGSTEFGSVTFNDPSIAPFDPMSVGRPMRGVDIRILDRELPRAGQPLPAASEGQVAVAAPSMLSEYLDPGDSPWEGGYFLSGDLGKLDSRGRLAITGRVKLLIDVGGTKVNPLEVEAVLGGHPAVREVVVVAAPVSDTVSRLKAVIVWNERGDFEDLRQFARARLATFKVPRLFEERESIPRSPGGKILRNAVK